MKNRLKKHIILQFLWFYLFLQILSFIHISHHELSANVAGTYACNEEECLMHDVQSGCLLMKFINESKENATFAAGCTFLTLLSCGKPPEIPEIYFSAFVYSTANKAPPSAV